MILQRLALGIAVALAGFGLASPSEAAADDFHVGFSYHGRRASVGVGYSSHRDCHGYSYSRASRCAPVYTCAPVYYRAPLVYRYEPDCAPRYSYAEPCDSRVLFSYSFTPARSYHRYHGHHHGYGHRYGRSHSYSRYSRGYGCR